MRCRINCSRRSFRPPRRSVGRRRWRKSRNPKTQIPKPKSKRPGRPKSPGLLHSWDFELGFRAWDLGFGICLRPSSLPRRRRLLRLASGLAASLTLRAASLIAFRPASKAARGGSESIADAPRLGRGRGFLLRFLVLGGFRTVLAANQLHLRDLGRIAAAEADAQDARIAAGTLRIARRNRLEQLAHDILVGQFGEDETPRMERLPVRITGGDATLGNRDQPLDEGPELLRFRHRGFDALMSNERHRLVAQQRRAVLADASQLAVCEVVSHRRVP